MSPTLVHFFCTLIMALCWGPSFILIKIAGQHMNPFLLGGMRITFAFCMIVPLLFFRYFTFPSLKADWWKFLLAGFFSQAFPSILFAYGELYVTSALAGIINGMTPIVAVVFAHYFLKDEKMSKNKIGGVALGILGFFTILMPTILDGEIAGDTYGIIALMLAATSYATGMVFAKHFLSHVNYTSIVPALLAFSTLYMFPIAVFFGGLFEAPCPPVQSWLAVLSLSFLGTVLGYLIYYKILQSHGATALSMSIYTLPAMSMLIGWIFLGELVAPSAGLGVVFILLGMYFVKQSGSKSK